MSRWLGYLYTIPRRDDYCISQWVGYLYTIPRRDDCCISQSLGIYTLSPDVMTAV